MTPAQALDTDAGAAPYLFLDAQHGLCNRLRAMASGASIAARTGRRLVVIWQPDHHCLARLSDLFDYDGPVIEDNTAPLCRRFADIRYNYMEIEPGSVFGHQILPQEAAGQGRGDVYIRSAYTLAGPHVDHKLEQDFLRALVPAAPVRALIAGLRHPNQVALHIRSGTGPAYDHLSYEAPANWPADRHAELAHWRGKSTAAAFAARLDQLIAAGQADTVFLAADLPETYAHFATRYGDRVEMLRRDLYDRSVAQLQYALADLLMLVAADRFLASTWSSFSDVAQRLAAPGRPCEKSGVDF